MSQTGQQELSGKPSGSTRRKVNGEAFVADVRAGMDDTCLMEKHSLTVNGLWNVFDKLVVAGMLKPAELETRILGVNMVPCTNTA